MDFRIHEILKSMEKKYRVDHEEKIHGFRSFLEKKSKIFGQPNSLWIKISMDRPIS